MPLGFGLDLNRDCLQLATLMKVLKKTEILDFGHRLGFGSIDPAQIDIVWCVESEPVSDNPYSNSYPAQGMYRQSPIFFSLERCSSRCAVDPNI